MGCPRPLPQVHLFRVGDVVRVIDDIAEVNKLQEGHGGWHDNIALVRIGALCVYAHACICVYWSVFVHVCVRHMCNKKMVYLCVSPAGNLFYFTASLCQCLGHLGRVVFVYDDGDCRVRVNGYNWTLNPKCLTAAPVETPPDVPGMTKWYLWAPEMCKVYIHMCSVTHYAWSCILHCH